MRARGGRASVRQWKLVQDTRRDPCVTDSLLHPPGRWPPERRRYPESAEWLSVSRLLMDYSSRVGTPELLLRLAVGRVEHCPFPAEEVLQLREQVQEALEQAGHGVRRADGDRSDVPIDFRLLQSMLSAAEDPEVGLGDCAKGVRVGPGARLPRLPALYVAKRRWRILGQEDPLEYQQEERGSEGTWQRNYKSLDAFTQEVLAVLGRPKYARASAKAERRRSPSEVPKPGRCILGSDEKGQTRRHGHSTSLV